MTVSELKATIAEDKPRFMKKQKKCIEVLIAKGVSEQLSTEDFELDEKVEISNTTGEKRFREGTLLPEEIFLQRYPDQKKERR